MSNKEKWLSILTLAFGIALLPPIWAVISPYLGVQTGGVALICAGLYVASGNRYKDAMKTCIGFILGDIWAVFALFVMEISKLSANIELYLTLFILGALAVIIASIAEKYIYLPAWLCGWAIGLTIMAPLGFLDLGSFPEQIAVSMVVGVVYVGIGVDWMQNKLVSVITKRL